MALAVEPLPGPTAPARGGSPSRGSTLTPEAQALFRREHARRPHRERSRSPVQHMSDPRFIVEFLRVAGRAAEEERAAEESDYVRRND